MILYRMKCVIFLKWDLIIWKFFKHKRHKRFLMICLFGVWGFGDLGFGKVLKFDETECGYFFIFDKLFYNRMKTRQDLKTEKLRLFGCIFFAVVGITNLFASITDNSFHTLDLIILIVSILPMLIRKKMFLLLYGIVSCFIALFIGYACLTFSLNPEVKTSLFTFFMGFLLSFLTLTASLALIYVGLQSSNEKEFSLVNQKG